VSVVPVAASALSLHLILLSDEPAGGGCPQPDGPTGTPVADRRSAASGAAPMARDVRPGWPVGDPPLAPGQRSVATRAAGFEVPNNTVESLPFRARRGGRTAGCGSASGCRCRPGGLRSSGRKAGRRLQRCFVALAGDCLTSRSAHIGRQRGTVWRRLGSFAAVSGLGHIHACITRIFNGN